MCWRGGAGWIRALAGVASQVSRSGGNAGGLADSAALPARDVHQAPHPGRRRFARRSAEPRLGRSTRLRSGGTIGGEPNVRRFCPRHGGPLSANRVGAGRSGVSSHGFGIGTVGFGPVLGVRRSQRAASIGICNFTFPIYAGYEPDYPAQDANLEGLRRGFRQASALAADHRLHFYTTTEGLAVQYNRLGVAQFQTLPYPGNPTLLSSRVRSLTHGGPLRVTLSGRCPP